MTHPAQRYADVQPDGSDAFPVVSARLTAAVTDALNRVYSGAGTDETSALLDAFDDCGVEVRLRG